jgi:hypothetical protein
MITYGHHSTKQKRTIIIEANRNRAIDVIHDLNLNYKHEEEVSEDEIYDIFERASACLRLMGLSFRFVSSSAVCF